jgi:hypothetical protein
MPRGFSLAHALSTGQPHLPIQIHSENPPALPVARKGKGGRLLRRPQQGHPAATVADFRTAVLSGPPEIMNTDQGSQFTSFDWTDRLKRAKTKISPLVL